MSSEEDSGQSFLNSSYVFLYCKIETTSWMQSIEPSALIKIIWRYLLLFFFLTEFADIALHLNNFLLSDVFFLLPSSHSVFLLTSLWSSHKLLIHFTHITLDLCFSCDVSSLSLYSFQFKPLFQDFFFFIFYIFYYYYYLSCSLFLSFMCHPFLLHNPFSPVLMGPPNFIISVPLLSVSASPMEIQSKITFPPDPSKKNLLLIFLQLSSFPSINNYYPFPLPWNVTYVVECLY